MRLRGWAEYVLLARIRNEQRRSQWRGIYDWEVHGL